MSSYGQLCCRILAKPECIEIIHWTVEWTKRLHLSIRFWICNQNSTVLLH